ncbi:hypothetical protein L228DRAFT_214578 [Xylona heveae TC161]|uniref:Uncharacterized protein n=1 Tax=Xylona heveae (strain CBS 132557 / TC161) TaxID=1328760 RepID=A0A164ZW45_XYLHT|nr:hypothetical protein L228DRAFT_214578 [Xylona heveae TC161]KZF19607.1 hypothetical protein L228DRAFT_214578 [Xylona heveae TC161]
MKSIKSYFAPASKESAPTPATAPDPALTTPRAQSTPGVSGKATPAGSRPVSIYPVGDFRNSTIDDITEIKSDVMVNWLRQRQLEKLWAADDVEGEGVVLKKGKGSFTCCPATLAEDPAGLYAAVSRLNVKVAMTVSTRVIKLFLRRQDIGYVPLPDGLRLQILPSIAYLPESQKHQFAAFIQDVGILVVWDDVPRDLLDRAERIEKQLMQMIWREETDEKKDENSVVVTEIPGSDIDGYDLEYAQPEKPRETVLIQAFLSGLTLVLVIAAMGAGWGRVAQEIAIDGQYIRIAFVAVLPLQIWLALFFMQSVAGCVAQIMGPISQMNNNSKFYSGKAPRRLHRDHRALPHMTIQCPVYKEGLHSVIEPTIRSIKAAISTYEMQGGTANIFINDDGMQLIPEEEARMRQDFYEEHNIGWVARPKHNPKPADGEKVFIRAGKFKKASNMNYALAVSNRVEEKLEYVERNEYWTQEDENEAYRRCLADIIREDEGRTWAEGNIRVGDYILLIDSDTRVPNDCFLDAVSEMEQSPEVAIIQYNSGVMNVTDSFFERGITFFTNLIYTAIQYAVANGDVAPFVGHNAVLRWAAIQEIAYEGENGEEKFWSESTVSEDFDMALRLQSAGHLIRYGAYTGDGFKEGVSLTVYDELARWEKYAYGCSELIFHPIRFWPVRGPFTPLFRRFIGSCMPLPSKLTILAYIGTYYAIASAWILTLANYFIMGWLNGHYDHYYVDSFKIYIAIIVVFNCLGNVSLAVLRYRIEERSLFSALIENFKWILLLTVFLGGISLHLSQAILSHMFEIDMSWGATAKEVENTTFFKEIPKLLKKFKFTFIFCIAMAVGMVVLAHVVPPLWRIDLFVAIWPLSTIIFCHFFLPIALNPNLMLFTW